MNRVFLINSLQQVKQTATESVDAFYMRVKEKYNPLKLEELTPAQIGELVILAQLVNHCTNNSLRKKALKDGMQLKDFLSHARAFERAEHQAREITGEAAPAAINKVQQSNPQQNKAHN